MTPGTFTIPFYQGATWNQTLQLIDEATDEPFDLTGLGPFKLIVRKINKEFLAEVEGTGDYDATGIVQFEVGYELTTDFPIGHVLAAVVDANMEPYMVGKPEVLQFPPPEPPPTP